MTTTPTLETCAAGLELSPLPVWVVDAETLQVCWANDAALAHWRAADREELYRRDLLHGAPAKVLARLRHTVARVLAGDVLCEEWAFYPRGEPTTVLLHLRKISLPGGRDGMLNQAAPIETTASSSVLRALTAIRHLSTPVAYVGEAGDLRMQNPAAMAEFSDTSEWSSWFVDPDDAPRIVRAALAGDEVRVEARIHGRLGERWHVVEAHALRDPVLGDLGVLAQHRDETARLTAERTAAAQLLVLEQQRREILALSAPILSVGANTLAMPIIGRLDEARGREIMDRLLPAIAAQQARRVILDLTGVADMDDTSALRLRALFAAVRLLGATPVLTGVRPGLAVVLARGSLDPGEVLILRSLAEAL